MGSKTAFWLMRSASFAVHMDCCYSDYKQKPEQDFRCQNLAYKYLLIKINTKLKVKSEVMMSSQEVNRCAACKIYICHTHTHIVQKNCWMAFCKTPHPPSHLPFLLALILIGKHQLTDLLHLFSCDFNTYLFYLCTTEADFSLLGNNIEIIEGGKAHQEISDCKLCFLCSCEVKSKENWNHQK